MASWGSHKFADDHLSDIFDLQIDDEPTEEKRFYPQIEKEHDVFVTKSRQVIV